MTSTINLLRLLADPTRLRLLLLLEEEELSVAELQQMAARAAENPLSFRERAEISPGLRVIGHGRF